jgi:tryptophan 7-halogenase
MSEPVKRLIIVGGGTAGWMTACYIDRLINQQKPSIEILLIESPDVDVIGVGEATVHSLRMYLSAIGVSEAEFLKESNASLKHGIWFKGWVDGADDYFHAFEFPQSNDGVSSMDHWVNMYAKGEAPGAFDACVGGQTLLAKHLKSPKLVTNKDYEGMVPYGYHLDAILFGQYLRKVSCERGVKRIEDHVVDINLTETGNIKSLTTRERGEYQADFFIDCTGFAAILMEAMGNDTYIDYSDSLLCDRAVASRTTPLEGAQAVIRPYTTSTAKPSGWIWDIDLYNRGGKGYVHSSQFISKAEAEQELAAYMNADAADLDFNHLDMRIGRRKYPWYKNCVAIGLSAGFIEPLESTGIYFIDMAARFLTELIPTRNTAQATIDRYNDISAQLLDQTRDFIVLHYLLSQREDSAFWKHYKYEVKPSDGLAEKLALWKAKVPSDTDFADQVTLFVKSNYSYIMYGMGYEHEEMPGSLHYLDTGRSRSFIEKIQEAQPPFLQHAQDHIQVLNIIRGRADRRGEAA